MVQYPSAHFPGCGCCVRVPWTGPFRNAVRVGLDCSRDMERTVQVLAMHCVEAECRHRGQPRHHARTCPLNRQGTAAAAHPHACFSKGYSSTAPCTPLQHLWGSRTHTHTGVPAHTHTCARTHAYTHAHAHTHMQTLTRTCIHTGAHTHIHIHARKHTDTSASTHTHIHTQTPRHTRARTHTYTHMHADTHSHTHAYACTRCAHDGLRQYFSVASDAPTLAIHTTHVSH
jgi:hypothetical protein